MQWTALSIAIAVAAHFAAGPWLAGACAGMAMAAVIYDIVQWLEIKSE